MKKKVILEFTEEELQVLCSAVETSIVFFVNFDMEEEEKSYILSDIHGQIEEAKKVFYK